MRIEAVTAGNVASGIFCARGDAGEKMIAQQIVWLGEGLVRGQLALADDGQPIGFMIYYPVESAPLDVRGHNLYAIQCINVRRDQGGKGVGTTLLRAAIDDTRANGVGGLVVEGFALPRSETGFEFMPKAFFTDAGFAEVATRGLGGLLLLRMRPDVELPTYLVPTFAPPPQRDRLRIDLLNCSRCWARIADNDVVRQVVAAYGERVVTVEHDQNHRRAIEEMGMATGILLDGENLALGPVTEERIRAEIERWLRAKTA